MTSTKNSNFNRGLLEPFIKELNSEYENSESIWRKVTDDDDLFVAIRENYVNVYYKGNSLFKITLVSRKLRYSTHFKYLIDPDFSTLYLDQDTIKTNNITAASLDLDKIKKTSKVYVGVEKDGVHKIINSKENDNIIDLEIALSDKEEEDARIDFACLHFKEGNLVLKFYEAKHITNAEIRKNEKLSEEIDIKKVVRQIQRYDKALEKNIVESYKIIIENYKSLKGAKFQKWKKLKDAELKINNTVELVIFGYDGDQKNGKNFKNSIEILEKALFRKVLRKGDPKGLTNGIKSKISIFDENK